MNIKENRNLMLIQIKMFSKFTKENKDKLEYSVVNKQMINLVNSFNKKDINSFGYIVIKTFMNVHYEDCISFLCHSLNLFKRCMKVKRRTEKLISKERYNNDYLFALRQRVEIIICDLNSILHHYETKIIELRRKPINKNGNGRYVIVRRYDLKYVTLSSMCNEVFKVLLLII